MRAEGEYEIDVTFEVDDSDFYSKVDDRTIKSDTPAVEIVKLFGSGLKADVLGYDGDLKYVNKNLVGVDVTVTTYVVDGSDTHKVDVQRRKVGSQDLLDRNTLQSAIDGGRLATATEVIFDISTTIDCYGEGDPYNAKNADGGHPDGVDDRDQSIITVAEEGWNDRTSAGSGKYTKSYYVASDKDAVEEVIEDLASYDLRETVKNKDGKRETYRLVYYVNDDEVEAVWEVRADKDDKRIVWNSTPSSSDTGKDLNGDGKVSCDEYYGTTGLVWSDKLNACVVSSTGDAVVTIPNTATK